MPDAASGAPFSMTVTGVAPWTQHAPSPQPLTITSIYVLSIDDKDGAVVEMKEPIKPGVKDETGMHCISGNIYGCSYTSAYIVSTILYYTISFSLTNDRSRATVAVHLPLPAHRCL